MRSTITGGSASPKANSTRTPRMPGLDLEQHGHVADQVVDVDGRTAGFGAVDELPQVTDDLAGPLRLLGDLLDRVAHVVHARAAEVWDVMAADVGVVGDGRQGLVQLVRQAGDHFAHRRQPADVGQLVEPLLGLLLGPAAARSRR